MRYKQTIKCFFAFLFPFIIISFCIVNIAFASNRFYYCKPHYTDTGSTALKALHTKTFLALGDSYTIGQSVDSSERFPAQTAAILKRRGYVIPSIDYIATTGWKTVNLQWAIEAQRTKKTYDVVTLLIGVNDQYLKKDTLDYREHFTNLLKKAIEYTGNANAHVFVLSIPDYGVTPFANNNKAVSKQLDDFNAINKEVAKTFGVNYTDVTSISRYDAIDSSMLAWDDLHPSGKQYAQWAQALANKMVKVFE